MDLEHSFTIPVPPERAWQALLDVEQVAPCMPGATVDGFDGEVITGRIKVKVGPVPMTYVGKAHFTERDEATKTVVLEASGKETRGSGTASATVRSSLQDEGGQTRVVVRTTMNVTGRPAQFGRGVMAEVGGKIIGKFATNLAAQLSGEGARPSSRRRAAAARGRPRLPGPRAAAASGRGGRERAGHRCGPAAHGGAGPAGPSFNSLRRAGVHTVGGLAPAPRGTAGHRRPGPESLRRSRAGWPTTGWRSPPRRGLWRWQPPAAPRRAQRLRNAGRGHGAPGLTAAHRGHRGSSGAGRRPRRPAARPVRRAARTAELGPGTRAPGRGPPGRGACCRRAAPGPRTRTRSTCSAWPACRCSSGSRRCGGLSSPGCCGIVRRRRRASRA